MKCLLKLLALTVAVSAIDLTTIQRPLTAAQAGALELYLNTTSLNNILQIAVPLLAYYKVDNATFNPDYHSGGMLYTLDLQSIHVNSYSQNFEKVFEMIPKFDNDQLHLRFSGIDLDLEVNGGVKVLHFIPLTASGLVLKNVTIDIKLESKTGEDGVHWSLVDATYFHFDAMSLKMKNWFLNKLVQMSQKLITKMVLSEMPKISKMIDQKVLAFNNLVQKEGPYSFVMPLYKQASINLTMTEAPDLRTQDLIKFYFDGLILDRKEVKETVQGVTTPPRIPHYLSEQVWIHEKMLNSLVDAVTNEIFPIDVNDESITGQLLQVFSELKRHYGKDVKVGLRVNMNVLEGDAINLEKDIGLILGNQKDVSTNIDVICSNANVQNEVAFSLNMLLEARLNLTVLNFVVFPDVKSVTVSSAKVVQDNIGMFAHDYNKMFNEIFKNIAMDLNTQYSQAGFNLANLNPYFGLITGILKNFTVTPYLENNFLFVGFEMQADMPTLADYKLETLQAQPKI